MSKGWKLDPRAAVASELEEMARDGRIARRAERDGIDFGDAMVQLAEELWRPYKAIEEKYKTRLGPRTADEDEERIDARARSYADKHNVSYSIALEAVLPGSTGPVELATSEKPKVDAADAAINRKAEARARREGVSFETALDAVLDEGR